MFEFLLGYWIGKDSQIDPKGTLIALMIVPPGLLLAFWAYFAIIDFSKTVWAIYLTYSTYTTINIDLIILAVLGLLNFFVNRFGNAKDIRIQLILLAEKLPSAILMPWVLFDIVYKSKFIEQFYSSIQTQIFGVAHATTEVAHVLVMPEFMNGLSFYPMIVGALAIGTIVAPFVAIGAMIYLFYVSKTASAETRS
jgi:hypothetical protein